MNTIVTTLLVLMVARVPMVTNLTLTRAPVKVNVNTLLSINIFIQARRVDSVEGGSFIFWEVFFLAWEALTRGSRG